MFINSHELFSSAQPLPALGDAVSRPVDTSYLGNLGDAERPFLYIQSAPATPRSEGVSVLEVGLLHSEDCQRFEWAFSPVKNMITRGTAWAITPARLPKGLGRFLMLRYRVSGDRLAMGAVTAFLSAEAAEAAETEQRMRRQNPATAQHVYYPSGVEFPPGYNQPGKYQGERRT